MGGNKSSLWRHGRQEQKKARCPGFTNAAGSKAANAKPIKRGRAKQTRENIAGRAAQLSRPQTGEMRQVKTKTKPDNEAAKTNPITTHQRTKQKQETTQNIAERAAPRQDQLTGGTPWQETK